MAIYLVTLSGIHCEAALFDLSSLRTIRRLLRVSAFSPAPRQHRPWLIGSKPTVGYSEGCPRERKPWREQ
jgi:hypothetical protein